MKRLAVAGLMATAIGLGAVVGGAAQGPPEPFVVVWVREGYETRVELTNVPLPDCLPGVAGTLWSPPMFTLPWVEDHEGPLPWTSNLGTSQLMWTGFQVDGLDALVHLHVVWNTTEGPGGEVLPDLAGGRIVTHFMVYSDHDPLCEWSGTFIRKVHHLIGDVNGDGVVAAGDIADVVEHFGQRQ
jgi:hypothetical protein